MRHLATRRRRLLAGIGLLAAVLIGLGSLAAWDTLALRRNLLDAQRHLDRASAVAEPALDGARSARDIEAAIEETRIHLDRAETSLSAAQRRTNRLGPLFALGARLPGWPEGLDEIDPLVRTARSFTEAGLTLSVAFQSVLAQIDRNDTGDTPVSLRLVQALTEAEPAFVQAHASVEKARTARGSIDAAEFRGPLAPGGTALERFDAHAGTIYDYAALLADLPGATRALLGMEGARTYAVLGQNSSELRPTGGFIGSLGLVTVDGGQVVAEDYRSSYAFENRARGFPPLPWAMAQHLGSGGWGIRDANWSPDFPTSAQTLAAMLAHHQDIEVDGVIGFTTYTVGAVLDALGSVTVAGIDAPVTAQTWYRAAEEQIYFPADSPTVVRGADQNKETVLEPILQEVMRRVQHASAEEMPALVRAIHSSIKRRELLFSFRDPAPAKLVRGREADGRVAPPEEGDVLALFDANLSYSKVGPYVRTSIHYEVWLDERGRAVESRATVSYKNGVTEQQAREPRTRIGGLEWDASSRRAFASPGVYGTYARFYVPLGSDITEGLTGSAAVASSEDLGFLALGRYERVPASGSGGFSYTYRIPAEVNRPDEYRLRVIKQPGTTPDIEVRIHLPAGVQATADRPLTLDGDTAVYRGSLSQTIDLRVRLNGTAG
jgi:hypothetical protein